MKNKIVTHFYVKESKKDRRGMAPIYLRITINGERAEISTDRRVNPDSWDKDVLNYFLLLVQLRYNFDNEIYFRCLA